MPKELKERFEGAFDKEHIGNDTLEYVPVVDYYTWTKADKFDSAKWAAHWILGEAIKEVEERERRLNVLGSDANMKRTMTHAELQAERLLEASQLADRLRQMQREIQ